MSDSPSGGRTFVLFALVAAGSAAVALPLFGLTPAPWSDARAAPVAETKAKPAKPADLAKASDEAAAPAVAPRKKTRIVWMGGGSSGPANGPGGEGPKATNPNAYRMSMNSGSTVKIQPVGGYIATTATSSGPRRGG